MYALDEPILDVDICIKTLVVIDHPPSFDQQPLTLQESSKDRERERAGDVEISPDILMYCTLRYVIHDLITIL